MKLKYLVRFKKLGRSKLYGVCRRLPDGTIEGLIQKIFGKEYSKTHIGIYNKVPLHLLPSKTTVFTPIKRKKTIFTGHFVVRIHSKKCPITVDISQLKLSTDTFHRKNCEFKIKQENL